MRFVDTPQEQQHRDDLAHAIKGMAKRPNLPLIEQVRKVVETKSAARVKGLMLDLFTASHIIQVHDALSPANQAKFAAMPLRKMASIAFKIAR